MKTGRREGSPSPALLRRRSALNTDATRPNRVLKIADRLIEPAQGAERATTMQVAASMLRTQSKRLLAVCKRILGAAHVEQQRAQIGMHIGVLRSFGKRKVVLGKGVLMVF